MTSVSCATILKKRMRCGPPRVLGTRTGCVRAPLQMCHLASSCVSVTFTLTALEPTPAAMPLLVNAVLKLILWQLVSDYLFPIVEATIYNYMPYSTYMKTRLHLKPTIYTLFNFPILLVALEERFMEQPGNVAAVQGNTVSFDCALVSGRNVTWQRTTNTTTFVTGTTPPG